MTQTIRIRHSEEDHTLGCTCTERCRPEPLLVAEALLKRSGEIYEYLRSTRYPKVPRDQDLSKDAATTLRGLAMTIAQTEVLLDALTIPELE